MKTRLFLSTTLIISAGLLAFLAVSIFIMNRSVLNLAETTVVETARITAGLFSEYVDLDKFVNAGYDSRITVISSDGTVLADTWEAESLPDGGHLNRPEIMAAYRGDSLVHVRHSATHGIDFMYYALRVETRNGHVFIRTALPVEEIDAYLRQSVSWFFGTLIFLALVCFFVIRDIASRILAPFTSIENNLRRLALGKYKTQPIAHSFPEIDNITRGIDTISVLLQENYTRLQNESRRREEFFANASHELKTPLTAIKGFNELADAQNTDERITKYINGISRETNRLMSLIGDMLKLSELENASGKNPVPVALLAIVNEVKETFLPALSEKSITFEASGNAKVLAEPNHIYEIVKNLIENAIRYNGSGGTVTVAIRENGDGASFAVSDNGIGISPGEQSKIFERFYRVEKSRSAEGGGTGLGLAIVKHICALYGWKLSLKSKPGVGTTVTVEF